MKNRLKYSCVIFFSLILLFSKPAMVQAKNLDEVSINTMAKNFAVKTIGWKNVSILNIKNLYDFNNKLIAYSVDIKNNNKGINGYEIISASSENDPILEFSETKNSPYSKVNNNYNCIYGGILNYYSQNKISSKAFYDLKTNSKLSEKQINTLRNENREHKAIDKNKAIKETNMLLSYNSKLQDSNTNETKKVLEDVPDEYWFKGCVPSGVAMVLEYDYYNNTPTYGDLVNQLAVAFGTDKQGNTTRDKLVDGVKSVMKQNGVDNVWCQLDGEGRDNSTYDKYVNEINNNYPVAILFMNCKYTTNMYKDGFHNHCCAGVGYKYNDTERFIVIHDEAGEGDVYCDFNSSDLGTNQWLYIH